MEQQSIGIVGAGFTGSLLALHLLDHMPRLRVYLIEKRTGFGEGLAYSTGNRHHLLNVRSGRMSAFDDRPDDFVRWLAKAGESADPAGFAPRQAFGAYVRSLLTEQLWGDGHNRSLYLVHDEAVTLRPEADGIALQLASGRPLRLAACVLATGNLPPEPPPMDAAVRESGRYVGDPWDEAAIARIAPHDSLLIVGTGLTMVDFVLTMIDRGHHGRIDALSRRGLLPRRHADPAPLLDWQPPFPPSLAALLHLVRSRAGDDWRAAVDGLRPHIQGLWAGWDNATRRRFLRHLRPWWDIHRHRLAPAVARQLDDLLASGRLTVTAGKIADVSLVGNRVELAFRRRGGTQVERLRAAWLVNCSGPGSDYRRVGQALIRSLLDDGVIRPDALRLGIDVDESLRVIGRNGPTPHLHAAGPVTKGLLWEITAVPEIRRQCRLLAQRIVAQLRSR